MSDYIEIDEEKHDLIKKVAELQEILKDFKEYNSKSTSLKLKIKDEITYVFKCFLSVFYNIDKYNDILDLEKLMDIILDLKTMMIKNGDKEIKDYVF